VPPAQETPQLPQLAASVDVVTQAPPHSSSPAGQPVAEVVEVSPPCPLVVLVPPPPNPENPPEPQPAPAPEKRMAVVAATTTETKDRRGEVARISGMGAGPRLPWLTKERLRASRRKVSRTRRPGSRTACVP
jgi:hypothetical protein